MLGAVDGLAGTDAFIVIGEFQLGGAYPSRSQASTLFPGEGIFVAVVVAGRIANAIILERYATIGKQQIAPFVRTISVGIGVDGIGGRNTFSS